MDVLHNVHQALAATSGALSGGASYLARLGSRHT
jgi:hypothetical protein